MTLKKTLSLVLTLALMLSVLAPCGLHASAEETAVYYGSEKLVQVTAPAIGGSYFMGADVNGTMYYFVWEGKVTDTAPYSLHATDDFSNANVKKVTLADPAEDQSGFQITFVDGANIRTIYSYDALTSGDNKDVVDTGAHSPAVSEQYHYKHNFSVQEYNGQYVLRKAHFDTVLAVKYFESVSAWRMLCVEKAELENEGVYPVMLLQEHEHSFGSATVNSSAKTASRSCSICGYVQTVYGNQLVNAEKIVVGNQYYLAANVDGLMYYVRHGAVTETVPYSLPAMSDINHSWKVPMTFAAPVEGNTGYQITYTNPTNGNTAGIYCYDVGNDGTVDTGVNATPTLKNHTYYEDTVNGVSVLRCLGNNYVLAIQQMDVTSSGTTTQGYRMLGVPEADLANEGVYPVTVLEAHTHQVAGGTYKGSDAGHQQRCWCGGYGEVAAHTYGAMVANDNVAARVCSVCGYSQVVMDQKYVQVKSPAIDETYYLSANVGGTLRYFCTPPSGGSVTNTSPYSLYTTESAANSMQVTLLDAISSGKGEFQLSFDNAGAETFIYCHTTGTGTTKTSSTSYYTSDRATFFMDEMNGVTVLRKYGNNYVLVVKQLENSKLGSLQWHMQCVPEAELSNEGVYPVTLSVEHAHNYTQWVANENGTTSHVCEDCGHEVIYYGTDTKVTQVDAPVIGESYYLVANANGTLIFFRHGVATDTAPYSLVATDNANHNWVLPVTIEDPTTAEEGTDVGFQMTYINPSTNALARIYCYDVLKDTEDVPGQTGVMDTGINSVNYRGRHTFQIAEVNGMKVLKKLSNNNILVAKYNETKGQWRMLGVPEAELANEGVYPVMLANAHTHSFGEAYYGDADGHWHLCECGSKSAIETHTVESWTVVTPPSATEPGSKSGVCTICGETAIVETPVTVSGWNIVLGDNIGVNFVLALTEGDIVTITVGGQEVPVELTSNGNGTYKVFIELAAAQMADEIVISVNGYAIEKTYSVRAYADVIFNGDYTTYTKNLVANMLVYGSAAQTYFNHNLDNLAGKDIELTLAEPGEAPELVVLNELTNVKYYGASLLHKEKTAVRFYFTADSIENLTFQVDGNIYEPVSKDGMYYIDVAEINPQDLDDTLNVVVTDGTNSLAVQYSPLIYISRMYHKSGSNAANKAMVQAMYNYHLAAKAYLANLNLSDDFAVKAQTERVLYEGVTLYEKTYVAAGYGEVEAYVLAIDAAANVELKVSAGAWDETNNAENPAEAKTVANHFRAVKNAGYNVLAMINGGFFDLNNTKSYVPYGVQIVDGEVKQAPSTDNNYSDNWFGMTTDGKYVISNAAGYADYEGNVQQAVGGGKLLIVDGVPVDLTSDRAYRTAVGVNANGDLVMVAVADATYSDVCHIFVDMGLDIVTVLNLDGGGSTAMYVPGAYYPKALILGDDGFFPREVADAVAIVVKK